MGMYTELHYNVELRKDVPAQVIAALEYMLDHCKPEARCDHPLFKTDRWSVMLSMDSCYFAAETHSTLRFDDISDQYYLCVRSNLKNYDSEIEKFIDWMDPYVDAFDGDFLGFHRYEESEDPVIIRKRSQSDAEAKQ